MPTNANNVFANPEKKSLDKLSILVMDADGQNVLTPALDKYWAPRSDFSTYVSLIDADGQMKTDVSLEEWQYNAECFSEDIKFLLNCKHHEFWSYMVYQKGALSSIVQFLQKATPFYIDLWLNEIDKHIEELYEEILCLVVRIICRLITNKESDICWISPEAHSDLIYKNFLLSVPMLFDLLMAVGNADHKNVVILTKIINDLLRIQPKYKEDISDAVSYFSCAFRSIQTQTENEGFEGAGGGILDENAETPYDDVVFYTLDCAYSLSVLLEVYPDARNLCYEKKLGQSIAQFYDNTLTYLYRNIYVINETAKSLKWLNQARLQFLKAFRSISYLFVETVLNNPDESLIPSENFIGLLTECLSEQVFVVDYEREYPVELDIDILKEVCKDLDSFKSNYVAEGYKQGVESSLYCTIGNGAEDIQNVDTVNNNNVCENITLTHNEEVPDKSSIRNIDVEATAVRDVFPHLDAEFVRKLLSRYDNSEDVIAAVLEGNLPPDLVTSDKSEPIIPPDPQDKLYEETGIKHFNVFDGDAYDVMTQDNPNCIIKQGKGFPSDPKNVTELLDDKSHLIQTRHRYQEYTLVSEDVNDDEYNDEYDDSYEALLEGDKRTVKSKEMKDGLANVQDESESEDSESEENSLKIEPHTDKFKNFCENPEDVRARYEAHRQAKFSKKGVTISQKHDVAGTTKGQGQDKDTLRNRNKKEINKSSRANHNRKAGAAFKRSKGMLP